MYYYVELDDDNKKIYYIYEHFKSLASTNDGWFHNCYFCTSLTYNFEPYNYYQIQSKLCICKYCKPKYKLENIAEINTFINNLLLSNTYK